MVTFPPQQWGPPLAWASCGSAAAKTTNIYLLLESQFVCWYYALDYLTITKACIERIQREAFLYEIRCYANISAAYGDDTGKRPFKCSLCCNIFTYPIHLSTHVIKMHREKNSRYWKLGILWWASCIKCCLSSASAWWSSSAGSGGKRTLCQTLLWSHSYSFTYFRLWGRKKTVKLVSGRWKISFTLLSRVWRTL